LATTALLFARRVYWQRWWPPWLDRRRDRAAAT